VFVWKFTIHWERAFGKLCIDVLELEFKKVGIFYEREKEYSVNYKGTILSHKFYADFVLFDQILLEVKE